MGKVAYLRTGSMALVISIAHAKAITDPDAKIGERKRCWLDERESLPRIVPCCILAFRHGSSSFSHQARALGLNHPVVSSICRKVVHSYKGFIPGLGVSVGFGSKVNNKGLCCLLLLTTIAEPPDLTPNEHAHCTKYSPLPPTTAPIINQPITLPYCYPLPSLRPTFPTAKETPNGCSRLSRTLP